MEAKPPTPWTNQAGRSMISRLSRPRVSRPSNDVRPIRGRIRGRTPKRHFPEALSTPLPLPQRDHPPAARQDRKRCVERVRVQSAEQEAQFVGYPRSSSLALHILPTEARLKLGGVVAGTVECPRFPTHTLVLSNTRLRGLSPAGNSPRFAPSLARSRVTVSGVRSLVFPALATQTLLPSKTTPNGFGPARNVPPNVPSLALTFMTFRCPNRSPRYSAIESEGHSEPFR